MEMLYSDLNFLEAEITKRRVPTMHTLTGLSVQGMFTLKNSKDKSYNHCYETSRTTITITRAQVLLLFK